MAMTLVSTTQVPSGGAASIEFTNIPQTGKDLLILVSTRLTTNSASYLNMRLNGNTGNVYSWRRLVGNGSTASSDGLANDSYIIGGYGTKNNDTASTFGNTSIYISNYTSTAAKSLSFDGVSENNATSANQSISAASTSSTSAITSFSLINFSTDTFAQHSTVTLYTIE